MLLDGPEHPGAVAILIWAAAGAGEVIPLLGRSLRHTADIAVLIDEERVADLTLDPGRWYRRCR